MEGIRAGGEHHSKANGNNQQYQQEHKPSPHHDASPHPPSPQTLSPKQGAEAMVESGVNRHAQRIDVLFLKAVWGGIFLSYGGFLEFVVGGSSSAMENNPGLLRLVEGLVFPVGLTMIVLTGTELLTSDMMFILLAALKGRIPWWGLLYNYFVVFWGNMAGSLFFANVLIRYTGLVTPPISSFVQNAATSRSSAAWHELFLRGIGCNILVNMSVYLASQASDLISKVVGIFIPLSTFVALQYEHVVADMLLIPMGIILNAPGTSIGLYIWKPMLAALFGNFVGAAMLGLSLYWFYLHDTSASPLPDSMRATNGVDVEDPKKKTARKIGPFGKGTFGHPTKLQYGFKESGYDRHHF